MEITFGSGTCPSTSPLRIYVLSHKINVATRYVRNGISLGLFLLLFSTSLNCSFSVVGRRYKLLHACGLSILCMNLPSKLFSWVG